MNSKSNRSYKLRTKQMAIHIRAFEPIKRTIVQTEEALFTIDDIRAGKCAVKNDCGDIILQAVLASAFPMDHSICGFTTPLPTQSAIKFFNQINK